MPVEPKIPFYFELPASMAAELEARHAAASGLPNSSRGAVARAAVGAYLVHLRQTVDVSPPAAPIARQRSRVMSVPPLPIARRAAG